MTTRVLCTAALALLPGLVSTVEAADQHRTWQMLVDGKQVQLKQENQNLYMATPEEVAEAKWNPAGSLAGFDLGPAGLYVGDLDGSGQTSLAFRDAARAAWYHGLIANGQITFQKVPGEVFQVGSGPTLYPLDDLAAASVKERSALAVTQPVMAKQFTRLATSRHMETTVTVFPSGSVYCYTWVHNGVWLTGFHGQAQVVLLDQYKRPIIDFKSPKAGVTGTLWGAPDARFSWQANISGDALAAVREVAVIQYWSPEFDTVLKDAVRWAKLVLELAQPLKSIFGL